MAKRIRKSQIRSSNLQLELYHIINSQTIAEVETFLKLNKHFFSRNFDSVLPQLILSIDSALVQSKTIYALTLILDETPANPDFSEQIFRKLMNLIVHNPDFDAKELALNCLFKLILSMTLLSSQLLLEFFSYSQILFDNSELTLSLRSTYLQCLGSALIISDGSIVSPTTKELNDLAFTFFNKDKIELREAAYCFFYLVIPKFAFESEEYVDRLMEEIKKSFKNEIEDFEYDNEDENDYDYDLDDERVNCQSIFMNEKSAALQLILSMSRVYPNKLIGRLTDIDMVLDYSFKLENLELSEQSVDTSYKLLKMLYLHSKENFKLLWYNKIIHTYTQMLGKEESKETVAKILIYLRKLLKIVGKHLIPQVYIGVIIKQIVCLLQDSAVCQEIPEESQDSLMDSLTELVFAMVKLWKIEFSPRIQDIFYLYLQKSALTNSVEIVNIFIGEIGNLISEFSDLAYLHFETLLNRIEAIFHAEEDILYRNSVYTLGKLCEVTGNHFNGYPRVLNLVFWLLDNDTTPGVVDNGVVAICRAILACPSSIPEQYYFIVLKNLPLKEDFDETKTVFKFLSYLLDIQGFQDTEKVLKMIIDGIADNLKDCSKYSVDKEDLGKVKKCITEKVRGDCLEKALQTVCEENKRIFKDFLEKVNF